MAIINENTSKVITLARFPLALMVVLIHSVGDTNAAYYHLRDFISHPLLSFVVPTFFIMSGYLFFAGVGDNDWGWYKQKLQKRLHTLLIPYLLWSLFTLALDLVKYLKGSPSWLDYGELSVWQVIYSTFLDYQPLNLPLWYVRDLFLLVLITPVLWYAIKKSWMLTLLLVGLWYFMGSSFVVSPVSMLFFVMGGVISSKGLSITLIDGKMQKILLWLVAIIMIVAMWFMPHEMLRKSFAVVMPFAFFAMAERMAKYDVLVKMGKTMSRFSEIVFYSHFPLTLYAAIVIMQKVMPEYSLVVYFVTPLLAAAISIMLQLTMDKIKLLRK